MPTAANVRRLSPVFKPNYTRVLSEKSGADIVRVVQKGVINTQKMSQFGVSFTHFLRVFSANFTHFSPL